MKRIKKIVFGLFVFLAIAIGVWAYLSLKNNKKPKVDALSMLPDNCLVYLNTNNFFDLNKKINSQSLIADKLKLFADISTLCNTLNTFDSLFTTTSLLEETLKNTTVHFALYNENLEWISTFNIKRLGNQALISSELSKILKAKKTENTSYEFTLNYKHRFYFTIYEGVVILSNSTTAINSAISASTKKLQNNQQFLEFKNTLHENVLLSLFVNHQLYTNSKVANKLNLALVCEKGFSAGNITLEPSQLTMNGYLKPDSSELIHNFYNQEPQSPDFLNLLPYNTSAFKAYGFSSFENLNSHIFKQAKNPNAKFWKSINDTALFNVESEFYQNTSNYLVNFETKIPDRNFIFLKIADTVKVTEYLKFMSDSLIFEDSILVYKLKTNYPKTPLKLFATFFNMVTNYVTYYNSHVFFSENKAALIDLINSIKKDTKIEKNESFIHYKNQNLAEDFNMLFYNSPTKNKETINKLFNFQTNTNQNPFENFKHFSYSVSNNKTNFKFRCQLLNETHTVNKEQNALWTLNLDAPASMQVNGFTNHITNENELVIQDEAKILYLINAKGTILWKKQVNEKINSKVFTVDIFRNNKYQLLFSSENYLHLIDRNGKYVQGYPVKLPEASSSELSVFDYDSNKNYRLFIACKSKTIYNYSLYGIKQEGFNTIKTDAVVNLPIQYVKVGLSDYLVAVDVEGKIYTYSRKGEGRIGLKNKTISHCSAFYIDATNNINSTFLIYVDDKNNSINKISFADKKSIEILASNINNSAINFDCVDDNKAMDIIVTKPNSVLAYNLSGNPLFEKTIESELTETDFYNDENHALFLAFSSSKKQLFLIDQLKQNLKSLGATAKPLISNLFNDNKKFLIVTNGSQLNCITL